MSALQGLRILVVENDEMSASLLEMQLMQIGAEVVGLAATVADAVSLVETKAPQVVLLDYRLAGNETSEPVAELLALRGIPFVLATGMAHAQLPAVFDGGELLVKPYMSNELQASIDKALRRHTVAS